MKEKDYQIIAYNIKKYRKLRGLTQEKMAFELDVDSQYYSQLEQGRRHFTLERIIDCAEILGVEINDIIPEKSSNKEKCDSLNKEITSKLSLLSYKDLLIVNRLIDTLSL